MRAPRSALFQGSIVALVGVPAFVVTLAGYQIWQGVIQKSIPQGVIVIQNNTVNNVANYFFSKRAGWIMAFVIAGIYLARRSAGCIAAPAARHRRAGPWLLALRTAAIAVRRSASSGSATRTAACRSCCS